MRRPGPAHRHSAPARHRLRRWPGRATPKLILACGDPPVVVAMVKSAKAVVGKLSAVTEGDSPHGFQWTVLRIRERFRPQREMYPDNPQVIESQKRMC